ncbi:MAG TPA: hypothetical protein VH395_08905 [Jatrophihabitantaceae bacterium]
MTPGLLTFVEQFVDTEPLRRAARVLLLVLDEAPEHYIAEVNVAYQDGYVDDWRAWHRLDRDLHRRTNVRGDGLLDALEIGPDDARWQSLVPFVLGAWMVAR